MRGKSIRHVDRCFAPWRFACCEMMQGGWVCLHLDDVGTVSVWRLPVVFDLAF